MDIMHYKMILTAKDGSIFRVAFSSINILYDVLISGIEFQCDLHIDESVTPCVVDMTEVDQSDLNLGHFADTYLHHNVDDALELDDTVREVIDKIDSLGRLSEVRIEYTGTSKLGDHQI